MENGITSELLQPAKGGNPDAQNTLGRLAFDRNDLPEALSW